MEAAHAGAGAGDEQAGSPVRIAPHASPTGAAVDKTGATLPHEPGGQCARPEAAALEIRRVTGPPSLAPLGGPAALSPGVPRPRRSRRSPRLGRSRLDAELDPGRLAPEPDRVASPTRPLCPDAEAAGGALSTGASAPARDSGSGSAPSAIEPRAASRTPGADPTPHAPVEAVARYMAEGPVVVAAPAPALPSAAPAAARASGVPAAVLTRSCPDVTASSVSPSSPTTRSSSGSPRRTVAFDLSARRRFRSGAGCATAPGAPAAEARISSGPDVSLNSRSASETALVPVPSWLTSQASGFEAAEGLPSAEAPGPERPAEPWVRFGGCSVAGRARAGGAKVNQDRFFVHTRVGGHGNVHLFGVCDGHGRHGGGAAAAAGARFSHHVAQLGVNDDKVARIMRHAIVEDAAGGEPEGAARLPHDDFVVIASALCEAARRVQLELEQDPLGRFDASGTTLVAALLIGQHCLVANVGDSRACLCSVQEGGDSRHHLLWLSEDHKPDDPREQVRILKCGGLIRPVLDRETGAPIGPLRVWSTDAARPPANRPADTSAVPASTSHNEQHTVEQRQAVQQLLLPHEEDEGEDEEEGGSEIAPLPLPVVTSPGLAMSRSIGDALVTRVGVVCDPTVTYKCLRLGTDRGIVLGSDGLWDVADAGEVAACVLSDATPSGAAKALCLSARGRWVEGRGVADDVTVVVLRFRPFAALPRE